MKLRRGETHRIWVRPEALEGLRLLVRQDPPWRMVVSDNGPPPFYLKAFELDVRQPAALISLGTNACLEGRTPFESL